MRRWITRWCGGAVMSANWLRTYHQTAGTGGIDQVNWDWAAWKAREIS